MLHPFLSALFQAALLGGGVAIGWTVREYKPQILAALRKRWHGPGQ